MAMALNVGVTELASFYIVISRNSRLEQGRRQNNGIASPQREAKATMKAIHEDKSGHIHATHGRLLKDAVLARHGQKLT
jgi:hypothetical protein